MFVPRTARLAAGILSVVALAAADEATAGAITLRPVADTSLFNLNGGSNNFGGSTTMVVGTTASGSSSRALVRFDIVGNVPAQALITSAQLNLVVTKANAAGVASAFEVHRLLQPWGEGSKTGDIGAAAASGEATWFHRFFPTNAWSGPGASAPADFAADASAVANVDKPAPYSFGSSSNLVADVQSWLGNSDANFGWIVLSQSEGTPLTARRVGTREDPANAPTLVVDFILPPTIVEPALHATDCAFHFTVDAGFIYTVEYSVAFPATNWLVLTNFSSKVEGFEAGGTNSILDSPSRFFRLSRVPCNCR